MNKAIIEAKFSRIWVHTKICKLLFCDVCNEYNKLVEKIIEVYNLIPKKELMK